MFRDDVDDKTLVIAFVSHKTFQVYVKSDDNNKQTKNVEGVSMNKFCMLPYSLKIYFKFRIRRYSQKKAAFNIG